MKSDYERIAGAFGALLEKVYAERDEAQAEVARLEVLVASLQTELALVRERNFDKG